MPDIYTTVAGDTWDMIAYKTLGNEMQKNRILEKNMSCREVVIFPAGIAITIPDVELEVSEDLPPWKRGVDIE